ncbi:T9SS type A sorting domain-containing protein [Melioribacter sp. OK-6-Me]|uniref:T9SS type A sorting domain-containing protein n=1 Tax=unclassified Melioribacter TaxID=2627329 RepID=UPI003ED9FEFC
MIRTCFSSYKLYLFIFFLTLFFSTSFAQSITVNGKITASRFPVKQAKITFINKSDTTIQFSTLSDDNGNYRIDILTSVQDDFTIPSSFTLGQSYPNPFSSSTAIPYGLHNENDVTVTIYDVLGRVVRKFNVGRQTVGTHSIIWDGTNGIGQKVASGIYFYKLEAGGESQVKKMIFNQNGSTLVPLQGNFSFEKLNKNSASLMSNEYFVRISNDFNTMPYVIENEYGIVALSNDTTINFYVSYLPTVSINPEIKHQIIRGFGAANIVQWRPDMTDSEIKTAFGTEDGQLGLSILRIRIQPQENMWGTNVPTAKKAHEMGVKIVASPWSPPASMKTNNNLVGGELREDSYDDYAQHLKSFVGYMALQGVPIYAVSVQNEPDITVNYESCDWNAEQMIKFLRENAPAIGTKVMAPESYQFRHVLSDPILMDSLACANLDIVAGHIYGGGLAPYPLAEEKQKEIWMTEHLTYSDSTVNPTSWKLAFPLAKEINDVMKSGMSAYIYWYLVRFYSFISDGEYSSGRKGDVTKKGFIMSQYARFIRPGYYRIQSDIAPIVSSTYATAYIDPDTQKLIIVAINNADEYKENVFRVPISVTSFIPYTTSETINCKAGNTIEVLNGRFIFKMEPKSITTFISN